MKEFKNRQATIKEEDEEDDDSQEFETNEKLKKTAEIAFTDSDLSKTPSSDDFSIIQLPPKTYKSQDSIKNEIQFLND